MAERDGLEQLLDSTTSLLTSSDSSSIGAGVALIRTALNSLIPSAGDPFRVTLGTTEKLRRLMSQNGATIHDPGSLRESLERQRADKDALRTMAQAALSSLSRGADASRLTAEINKLSSEINQILSTDHMIDDLYRDYQTLHTYASYFNCSNNLSATHSSVAYHTTGTLDFGVVDLSGFISGGPSPAYRLCNENGTPLQERGGNYTCVIGGQTYTISGIIPPSSTSHQFDFSHVTVTPHPTSFPLKLELSVSGIYSVSGLSTGTVPVVHVKPFSLEITETATTALDHFAMDRAYHDMNASSFAPYRCSLAQLISQEYGDKIDFLQDAQIKKVLSEGGREATINQIWGNPVKKQQLIQRVKEYLNTTYSSTGGSVCNLFSTLTAFQHYVTDESVIKKGNRIDERGYKDYLSNHYQTLYAQSTSNLIYQNLSQSPVPRDQLLQIFSTFLHDEEQNKFDHSGNFLNLSTLFQGANFQRYSMRTCTAGILRNKKSMDYSYMLCGENREKQFDGEQFSVENAGEVQNYTYGARLKCGKNKGGRPDFRATFTINGQEYPTFIGASPAQIMRNVLGQSRDKNGNVLPYKLRVRMVIFLIKCFFALSPWHKDGQKDVLERNVPSSTGYQKIKCESSKEGGLKLIGVNIDPRDASASNTVLFDEESFKLMQDDELLAGNIETIIQQFTGMLNEKTQTFLDATTPGVVLESDFGRQFKRAGIVKRAFRWIFRHRKNYTHSFDTVISSQPPIGIHYDNGQRKKFTVVTQTEPPQIAQVKDIGTLLSKSLFYGCQSEAIEQITRAYSQYMRMIDPSLDTHRIIVPDENANRVYLVQGDDVFSVDLTLFPNALQEAQHGIPNGAILCDEGEVSEFYSNPFLSGKVVKYLQKHVPCTKKEECKENPFIPPFHRQAT